MSDTCTLVLNPNWNNGTYPIHFQATVAGGYGQQVTITGPGITEELKASSPYATPNYDYGVQFMHFATRAPYSNEPLTYTVEFEYRANDGVPWQPSEALNTGSTNLGDHGVMTVGHANDAGGDQDYNDCVVTISMWNQSGD